MFVLLICWVVIGITAGFVGTKVTDLRGDDPKLGMIAGALGAVLGGGIFHFLKHTPPNATDYFSTLIAAVAGVLVTVIWFAARKAAA